MQAIVELFQGIPEGVYLTHFGARDVEKLEEGKDDNDEEFHICSKVVFLNRMDFFHIFNEKDENYKGWYGTEEAIRTYLEKHKDLINGYNEVDGWMKNLTKYGLSQKMIHVQGQ